MFLVFQSLLEPSLLFMFISRTCRSCQD